MPKPLASARRAIERTLARSDRLEIASDFDGTLTPIASHPDLAVPSRRLLRVLDRLASMPRVRLALLSGRPLSHLEKRVGRRRIFLSGVAGFASRDERGRRKLVRGGVPRPLVAALEEWCTRFDGAWLERKGPSVAVHTRAVLPARRGVLGRGVRRMVGEYRGRVTIERGKQVYELRPKGAPSKADALARWLDGARPRRARRSAARSGTARSSRRAGSGGRERRAVFFFGDDANDEPALARVRAMKGFSIVVGRRRSVAEFRLASPREVVEFLERLGEEWERRAGGA